LRQLQWLRRRRLWFEVTMAKKETHKDLLVIPFKNQAALSRWLTKNFEQQEGIWIKFAKKASGVTSISYEQAREEALIFGWIDGQLKSWDQTWFLRKFTPRRPRSKWSKINREIVEQLTKEKRMKPSGMAQVEAAKADGRWEAAYDSQSTAKVPPELLKLLNRNKKAKAFFESITAAQRYSFIYRIQNAKREATKEKHVRKAFEMCKAGEVY